MSAILKRNNVTVIGEGEKVMLFAHGFGCDQNAWKYIKDAFMGQFRLVLFDHVGAGKSDLATYSPERYAALDGFATDMLEICEELSLKDIVFVGHSVSCMIGALAAIRQPRVFKKLVFIGPSPCYISDSSYIGGFDRETIDTLLEVMEEDYISWARSLAPAVMDKTNNGEELTGELAELFCSIDPVIAKNFARVTFTSDNRKDIGNIPVESLTIQCSNDNIAPLAVGKYINAHTPNNTLKVLNAFGHCPHMSHPKQTIAAINDYLYN
jgi:sigma-B regulation protein RsbQ